MNSEANAKQVGGDHYKTAYEHWDLIEDFRLPYLVGCATKYVARARKKNGKQDLEKAIHYIEKMGERFATAHYQPASLYHVPLSALDEFCTVNGLDERESLAIRILCKWDSLADLAYARRIISDILASL